ncbi:unnamed protein product [Diatraea saccharalis]|uniref:Zinc finger DNA binding protein n=1 Tax=Diatraea saccharalis TaxID=40085 RepID=A0A9N9REU7_9NEOP|nr:unnamed protein product [Diatraea saccharalis]
MDKSMSESNLDLLPIDNTPPNFIHSRIKRRREEVEYVSELDTFKEDIKNTMINLFTKHKEEFKDIMPTLKEMKQVNTNIQNSIEFLSKQNEEFKQKIEYLESQAKIDRDHISLLEETIEEIQKTQRKSNFEIKNVPLKDKETKDSLVEMALCLAKYVGSNLKATDVKDIYRVRAKKRDIQNTSIVVETNSTVLKTELIQMTKHFNITHKTKLCAKHLGFTKAEDTPIFITEHLTRTASRLHFLARDLAKSKGYKYCWTAYGKVRKKEGPLSAVKKEEFPPLQKVKKLSVVEPNKPGSSNCYVGGNESSESEESDEIDTEFYTESEDETSAPNA